MEYWPDRWVVVEINNNGIKHQRVFAGWYGGYAGSDEWKMNSGITKVVEAGSILHFHGESGSIYHCVKDRYGLTRYMTEVLVSYQAQQTDLMTITIVDDYGN